MNCSVASQKVAFRWSSGRPLSECLKETNNKTSLETEPLKDGTGYLWFYEPASGDTLLSGVLWQGFRFLRVVCMRWPLRILWDPTSLKEERRDSPGVCGRSPGAPQTSCFCLAPALFSWVAGFEGWAKYSSGLHSVLFCPESKVEKKGYGVLEHLSTAMKKSISFHMKLWTNVTFTETLRKLLSL